MHTDRQPRASHQIQLDFVTSPLRHCYPIYVSLQLDIWRRSALCVRVHRCVCLILLMVEFFFPRRGQRRAGNRTTERESFPSCGTAMTQAGYFGRV